jgi:7-cyano-7-deazaguanine synthase in queuosine biosynthesis
MGKLSNHYARRTIAVDFDGTLCRDNRDDLPGEPRRAMVAMVKQWHARGWDIVVHSSRPVAHNAIVMDWLDFHDVPYSDCCCGAKPPADIYVDDKGLFPGPEALDALVAWKEHGDPLGALAVGSMAGTWAAEQLMVPETGRQPAQGRQDAFAVALPVTGGMDSTTLWAMAAEAGVPAQPYYVDLGQEYATTEMAVARQLIGRDLTVITRNPTTRRFAHIIPGRNAAIIFSVAQAMASLGWWGELWLGNLAGESPPVGGDKSARFLSTSQQLLTLLGLDINLQSPLGALDKPDLVRWWAARGRVEELALTKSCFHPTLRACGRCQTCFRKFVAFHAAGEADALSWDQPVDWSTHTEKYWRVMTEAADQGDFSHYSPRRIRDTLEAIADIRSASAPAVD